MPDVLDGVASNETVSVMLVAAYADPEVPDLSTEYNAVTSVDASCLLVDPISPDASFEKASLRRACSREVRERAGRVTRTIADIVGVYDPQDLSAPVSELYAALEPGSVWYLTVRWGVHIDTPAAAGDLVDIYKVEVGMRTKIAAADNDELQFKAGLAILNFWEDVVLVA